MLVSQGSLGRVFTLRLEDGDRIPECIERFAAEQGLKAAFCSLVGGVGGGRLVAGPEDGEVAPPLPVLHTIDGVHEIVAVGAIFPDTEGRPVLHMHGSLGRGKSSKTGCIRPGLDVWTVAEVVLLEITGSELVRKWDSKLGLELLTKE